MRMQGYCDVYKWTILKRMSPEVKCFHPTSLWCEMCTSSVSNVIYHRFSHGAAFYMLNGKNVNPMLEYLIMLYICTKFCENISTGIGVTDLNSRVNAIVVANVDARTDKRTDEQKENRIPISCHA